MMLTRWQPAWDLRAEFGRLQSEMDRLFGRWGTSAAGRSVAPAVNLWEDESNLYVESELPGLELSDLELYVTGESQLTLKGERKRPEASAGAWHRQERGSGSFGRVIELPVPVDGNTVTAELKNGVLLVTLPKRQAIKPRRIEVKCD